MRRASPIAAAAAALALAALSGCVSDGAATDAGVDAHVIVVTDPIDARPPTRDAPIRDAGALPDATQYDAFPCLVRPLDQNVATLAGCAAPGATDGARSVARFNNPVNVVLGPDGDLYVADHDNHRIRAIKTADGTTRTVIDHAGFRRPWGMAFASDGRFYVQTDEDDAGRFDDDSGTLWVVDRSARRATVVLRGVGRPRGMAALGDGRIALADPAHHTVRLFVKVQPMDQPPTYAVQPLAGAEDKAGFVNQTGGAARFNEPSGVAVLPDGSLVVADQGNHRIRRVALDGVVTTFAGKGGIGSEDGAVADARFSAPRAVAADMNGDVWVADGDNHLIRKISGGMVSTVAGNGTAGYEDSNDRTAAAFFGMEGLDVAANGKTVWLADGTRGDDLPYHRVRRIRFP